MISRRALLRSTALIPASALLGCQAIAPILSAVPTIASDTALIAQALQIIMPEVSAITGLAGGAKNTISRVVDEVSSIAQVIGQGQGQASASSTTGLVQQFSAGISVLAGLFSGISGLPGIVSSVINDAIGLLPAIQSAVGLSAPARPLGRFVGSVSPGQARTDLALILARGR